MPDFRTAGTQLKSSLEYLILEDSELVSINEYNSSNILRCSYDPNDKQINPLGRSEEGYILRDEPVIYTLRFQNTGNDFARNVRLVDTLSLIHI